MKILCIFRDDIESQWLLQSFKKKIPHLEIMLETGSLAKKRKLKRLFLKNSFLLWPIKIIDIIALQFYNFSWLRYFKNKVGLPRKIQAFTIHDVNEKKCIQEVKRIKPSAILIFGTAIIGEDFLKTISVPIYNIHTGILPRYRNVHSEFWAYKNRDFQNLGVTIIHLDKGIDSGAIALQAKVAYRQGDSLFKLKLKNLRLITPLVIELLRLHGAKKVPHMRQRQSESGFYQTPTARDLLVNSLKIS